MTVNVSESELLPSAKTVSWIFAIYVSSLLIVRVLFLVFSLISVSITGISPVLPTIIFQIFMLLLFVSVKDRIFSSSDYAKFSSKDQSTYMSDVSSSRIEEKPMTFLSGLRLLYLTWGFVLLVGIIATYLLSPWVHGSPTSAYESLVPTKFDVILFLISAVILAPLAEELLFRKLLIIKFEESQASHTALVLSAFLFSMVHWLSDFLGSSLDTTLAHIFSTFVLGLVLGHIFQRTRDIRYTMVFHGLNNAVSGISLAIISFFPVSQSDLDAYSSGQTDQLSPTTLRNIMIINILNISLVALGGIAVFWLIIRLLRNRSEYIRNFRVGLATFSDLFVPVKSYIVLYALFGIVLLPWLFILIIPSSNPLLEFFAYSLGNIVIVTIAIAILQKPDS